MSDRTAGLNRFWSTNIKVQLDCVLELRDRPGEGPAGIGGVGARGPDDF